MMDILDPTIARPSTRIAYAERPRNLRGLRIGLIENTKKNSEQILRALADRFIAAHGMTLEVVVHKPQRAPLDDRQMRQLTGKADFVIAGVGD